MKKKHPKLPFYQIFANELTIIKNPQEFGIKKKNFKWTYFLLPEHRSFK